jgi:hypothetical protein
VARLPAIPTHPSRGPWLAIGLCCPDGSSLTTASSEPLNPSPPLMVSRRSLLHPRKSALGWESRGSPIYSAELDSRAVSHTPVARRVRMTVPSPSVLAFTFQLQVRRPHWTFRGCRVHSELIRAHVTARELASPPFEDVYIRACANPGHPESASNMTTWVNSQFPRPDFHRQVQRHYGLQNWTYPLFRVPTPGPPGHSPAAQCTAAATCRRPNAVSSDRKSWPSSV